MLGLHGQQPELAVDQVQVEWFSTNEDERVLSRRRHGCDEVMGCRSFGLFLHCPSVFRK